MSRRIEHKILIKYCLKIRRKELAISPSSFGFQTKLFHWHAVVQDRYSGRRHSMWNFYNIFATNVETTIPTDSYTSLVTFTAVKFWFCFNLCRWTTLLPTPPPTHTHTICQLYAVFDTHAYTHTHTHTHIQGVPRVKVTTSGECCLC